MPCELVAYYRVSTIKPGAGGHGVGAQEAAVRAHREATGCDLIASYTEVESGKGKDRPELAKALAHARGAGAVLVVAKMDRLARDVRFLSGLMEGGVDFVACDMPQASRLTIPLLAAVAEEEARLISARTKAALAVVKARGVKVGTPENFTPASRAKGAASNRDDARRAYGVVAPLLKMLRGQGRSLPAIARHLNSEGSTTRTGKPWTPTMVKRVLDRLQAPPPSR